MKMAFLVVTSKCNKSCSYCWYAQQNERFVDDRLSSLKTEQLLEGLTSHGFTDLIITGGEPLLQREIVLNCLHRATKLGMLSWLSTNAKTINSDLAAELVDSGLQGVHISVDVLGQDLIRVTSQPEFNHVMSVIEMFKSLGLPNICLTCVISSHNKGAVEPLYEMAKQLGIDLMLQPVFLAESEQVLVKIGGSVSSTGSAMVSTVPGVSRLGREEWRELTPFLENWGQETQRGDYVRVLLDHYIRGGGPKSCGMGRDCIVVDSDGTVFPCFHRRDLIAGNIIDNDLGTVMEKLDFYFNTQTSGASCFGEHCISLFS